MIILIKILFKMKTYEKKMVRFFCLGITLNALSISPLYAGFFDRTIKVQCDNELYTYEVVKNKIYEYRKRC